MLCINVLPVPLLNRFLGHAVLLGRHGTLEGFTVFWVARMSLTGESANLASQDGILGGQVAKTPFFGPDADMHGQDIIHASQDIIL